MNSKLQIIILVFQALLFSCTNKETENGRAKATSDILVAKQYSNLIADKVILGKFYLPEEKENLKKYILNNSNSDSNFNLTSSGEILITNKKYAYLITLTPVSGAKLKWICTLKSDVVSNAPCNIFNKVQNQ